MNIGEVLSRAWQILKTHKVLWIFGILASCSSTNLGSDTIRRSIGDNQPGRFQNLFNNINLGPGELTLLVIVGIIIALIIIALLIFFGTVGRIGMMRGTSQVEEGTTHLEFSSLFNASLPYFWRVFLLNLFVGVGFALLVFLAILLAIPMALTIILIPVIIAFFCLLAPLWWVVTVIQEQANIAIVLENLGIFDGLKRGWEVVRNNAGNYIVMALILGIGSIIGGWIITIPVFIFLVPALIGGLASSTAGSFYTGLIVSGLCLVVYIPVAIFLNGLLQGYIHSAWTLTYMRLTGKPAAAAA